MMKLQGVLVQVHDISPVFSIPHRSISPYDPYSKLGIARNNRVYTFRAIASETFIKREFTTISHPYNVVNNELLTSYIDSAMNNVGIYTNLTRLLG